jgi:hypothetical protein
MYQLISTIAKAIDANEEWSEPDISSIPLNILFTLYSKIIVILSNPFLSGNVAVDLDTIRNSIAGLNITIVEFLVQNGNNTLVALDNIPSLTPVYAKYVDGFHAGYKVLPITPTGSSNPNIPIHDKTWLKLTRPNTDYNLFYKSCLVSVNGFYHLTDTDNTGIYVVDGMKSLELSNQNNFGIYSFRELGALSFIPISSSMVYKQNTDQVYKDSACINLNVDISNKTIILVLGGYLHILDDKTFKVISKTSIKVFFNNLPFLDRYFESKNFIDLSTLPLSKTSVNKNQISITEFFSDENILAYLTLSQSFVVLLDNTNISLNKIPVRGSSLPDMFIGYCEPKYPLVTGAGKTSNYWYTYEDGLYSINTVNSIRNNPIYDTIDPTKVHSVSNSNIPNNPLKNSDAYLLEISGLNF